MNPDLMVNILLIIAESVLAFALFGAGALWKSKTPTKISELICPRFRELCKRASTEGIHFWVDFETNQKTGAILRNFVEQATA